MPSAPTRNRALAELVLSSLLFGVMAYLTKHATRRVGGGQAALVRFAVGLAVIGGLVAAGRIHLRPRRYDLLFLRGFFGGLAVLFYFIGIQKIPVGTATLLHYTAPVWTAIFAGIYLGERLALATVGALVIAGGGVALVVYGQGRALGGAYGWMLMSLGSAVVSGAAVTAIRAARRFDGSWEVFTAFSLLGILCTAPAALPVWVTPTKGEWLLLVAVGVISIGAQIIMTHALGAVEAATSGIIGQLTVITAMSLGHFVDAEPLTGLSAAGAVLTVVGVTLAARIGARPPANTSVPVSIE